MKEMNRIAFYVFIGFLVLGTARIVYGGPVYPIVEGTDEERPTAAEVEKKLQRLRKEIQKNIEKTEQLRLEEKQQEAVLQNIKKQSQQKEKQFPA